MYTNLNIFLFNSLTLFISCYHKTFAFRVHYYKLQQRQSYNPRFTFIPRLYTYVKLYKIYLYLYCENKLHLQSNIFINLFYL